MLKSVPPIRTAAHYGIPLDLGGCSSLFTLTLRVHIYIASKQKLKQILWCNCDDTGNGSLPCETRESLPPSEYRLVGNRTMQQGGKQEPVSSGTSTDTNTEKDVEGGNTTATTATIPTDESSEVLDPHIVGWNGPDDAENPKNWSSAKRWSHIILVAMLGLVTNFAPTIFAPGISQLNEEFQITSSTISTLAITLYVLGISIGPMFTSPLSEVYGRLVVYHGSMILFVVFVIANAVSQNTAEFLVFRFLSGCAGGTPLALGGGTIADVSKLAQRALAMALFSLGPMFGPVLGPVIGGFVASAKGWRWTFWVLAMVGGGMQLISFAIMRETHPKVILDNKAARLRKSSGNPNFRSKLARTTTPAQVLLQVLVRPTTLLFRSPILLLMSLYMGFIFGVMYLLFSTFDAVFQVQYGFSVAVSGLVYLGLGLSAATGIVFFTIFNPRIQAALMKRDGVTTVKPEHRLVLMIWFSPGVPAGLFIYGWATYYKVHWFVPILGTVLIGYGAFFVLMLTQLYLVELFGTKAAASALGANILVRYLGGTFLPLAGPSMYATLGLGWGNSLLGFVSLAFIPASIFLYKYGEQLRNKSTVKV
ncbi:hypothetical protein VHEMI03214 [[Torrubiella] hemipterigena]|uniref:Major facilitator superfamily (MFS) profile domain-containing protein n=1 Tax=[Torrubiella] hemipterigena TaxID=1531966 RepID=A0A0A1TCV3_9HYPO|nr:hypothetical protein VHEMI03214 [[Torrubiella] hemipterigena]